MEKSICADALLGKLDDALMENYRVMLASSIGGGAKQDLRITQRAWLKACNACTQAECIENAYRKRIDEVCEYPVITGVHPVCVEAEGLK